MTEQAIKQRREYQKQYRELNKEKINQYQREYREKNKEKVKEYNKMISDRCSSPSALASS